MLQNGGEFSSNTTQLGYDIEQVKQLISYSDYVGYIVLQVIWWVV